MTTLAKESASRGSTRIVAMVMMPIMVKEAARIAAGGSVASTTDRKKKPSISAQEGLISERTTRGSSKASNEKMEIAPSEPKPSWLTMSPPSPVSSAPAGWNGRNETMM